PGSYALQVSADGFETFTEGIEVGATNQPLTVSLAIGKVSQQVDVEENPNLISLDPDNNPTALVLKEEDIQSLPDDEDELIASICPGETAVFASESSGQYERRIQSRQAQHDDIRSPQRLNQHGHQKRKTQ